MPHLKFIHTSHSKSGDQPGACLAAGFDRLIKSESLRYQVLLNEKLPTGAYLPVGSSDLQKF